MLMILLIIILLLAFGGGGGYYGYQRWGTGGGVGIFGLVLIILVLVYVFGGVRLPPLKFGGGLVDRTSQGANELGCLMGTIPFLNKGEI
jgi:hypothetical protein